MSSHVLFSSADVEWFTPRPLFDKLDSLYHFELDPCASQERLLCPMNFTSQENGLERNWSPSRAFVNPPYGRKVGLWFKKIAEEVSKGSLVVALVASRTETEWWQDYVEPGRLKGTIQIRFIRGRLHFGYPAYVKSDGTSVSACLEGSSKEPAGFPSAVILFPPFVFDDNLNVLGHNALEDTLHLKGILSPVSLTL